MAVNASDDARPLVLVICDYYLPGFESGGAMRTVVNMVDRLSDEFRFLIVTRDHDGPLDRTPYTGVKIGDWNPVGPADVFYLPQDRLGMSTLRKLIGEAKPDLIYLNSFFSPLTIRTLILRRLGRLGGTPVVIAPEGEFSPGALALKAAKKRTYLSAAKILLGQKRVFWKAAGAPERSDILDTIGPGLDITIAPNMPPRAIMADYDPSQKPAKAAGTSTMVFVSRYMRKKNFNWLLKLLPDIAGELAIDIYGTIEEPDYHAEAEHIIARLPDNIRVTFKGPLAHEQVAATMTRYHFFVLPTAGENFGHVFIEALAAGCPLVISDRTPWRDLEASGVGWDLALERPGDWVEAIDRCVQMAGDEYAKMSGEARRYAVEWLNDPEVEAANRHALRHAIGRAAAG